MRRAASPRLPLSRSPNQHSALNLDLSAAENRSCFPLHSERQTTRGGNPSQEVSLDQTRISAHPIREERFPEVGHQRIPGTKPSRDPHPLSQQKYSPLPFLPLGRSRR